MLEQRLTIKGKFIGSGVYVSTYDPVNILGYCPMCGDTWVTFLYIDFDNPSKTFQYRAFQGNCGCDGKVTPLIFNGNYNKALNKALPRNKDFILYELNTFHKLMDQYKGLENGL